MDRISKETRSHVMASVKAKNTKPEMAVRSALHSAGFRFRLHGKKLPGKPDIYLSRYRVAIFVHGCFWHGHNCRRGKLPTSNAAFWKNKITGNVKRDVINKKALKTLGWRVFELWECNLSRGTARLLIALKHLQG